MKVVFREDNHTYWLGEKQLISVTRLLKKHGLATDYTGIDPEVLAKAAEKGKLVHKEIEEYIKNGEVGFTSELVDFIDIMEQLHLTPQDSEIILPCGEIPEEEADGYIYAGTADLICKSEDGLVLADIKTTSKVDKRAYAWQLTLYEHLIGYKFAKLYVLHLGKSSKAIPIDRIPDEEIERLLECERKGEIYSEPGLVVPTALLSRVEEAELTLKEAEAAKNTAEAAAKELRAQLYEAMTKQGISSWETLDKSMLITRVAPSTKTTIDGKKLKEDMPEVAEKYSKTSTTAGYVKITVRGA